MIEFIPYQGCGELRFGITKEEVLKLLGSPKLSARNWLGWLEMFYPLYIVHLGSESQVVEITFHPGTSVFLDGVDIMALPSGRDYLLHRSKQKYAGAGTIILQDLGIAISETLQDQSPQPITVFTKGRMDDLIQGYQRISGEE